MKNVVFGFWLLISSSDDIFHEVAICVKCYRIEWNYTLYHFQKYIVFTFLYLVLPLALLSLTEYHSLHFITFILILGLFI